MRLQCRRSFFVDRLWHSALTHAAISSLQAWLHGAPQATEGRYASTTRRPPTSERVIALLSISAPSRRQNRERRSEHRSRNDVQSRWSLPAPPVSLQMT